jgi:type IV secretion system protein VirB10
VVLPVIIVGAAALLALGAGGGWYAYETGVFDGSDSTQIQAPPEPVTSSPTLYDLGRKSPPRVDALSARVAAIAGKPTPIPPWFRPVDADGDPITEISVSLTGAGVLVVNGKTVPADVPVRVPSSQAQALFYLPPADGGSGTVLVSAASDTEGFGMAGAVTFDAPAPPPPPPLPPPPVEAVTAPPPTPPKQQPPISVGDVVRELALRQGSLSPPAKTAHLKPPSPPEPLAPTEERSPKLSDPDYSRFNLKRDESGLPVERERMITADRYVSAVLETPINSQLAGRIILQLDQNVFGSNGRLVLLPKGSRVVCIYEELSREGDTRLPVRCGRLIRPDGANILLTDAAGADQAGSMGFTGVVDNRVFERFGAAFILSGVSALSAIGADSADSGALQQGADALNENLGTAIERVIEQTIDLAPIMTVAAGSKVQLIASNDIYLRKPE